MSILDFLAAAFVVLALFSLLFTKRGWTALAYSKWKPASCLGRCLLRENQDVHWVRPEPLLGIKVFRWDQDAQRLLPASGSKPKPYVIKRHNGSVFIEDTAPFKSPGKCCDSVNEQNGLHAMRFVSDWRHRRLGGFDYFRACFLPRVPREIMENLLGVSSNDIYVFAKVRAAGAVYSNPLAWRSDKIEILEMAAPPSIVQHVQKILPNVHEWCPRP